MALMHPTPIDIAAIKARMRDTWMAGDFGVIARFAEKLVEEFVERLPLKAGVSVLDVACGTGNGVIPAARTGATVSGVDIATNLVEQARTRVAEQGLTVDLREGDAEQLAFPDSSFDVVMSTFGAMFAPRPEKTAGELLRVCKPGGLVAMANWTSTGFVGKTFKLSAQHVPPPPDIPAPVLWGDEGVARQRLGVAAKKISCTRRTGDMKFPFPPVEVVQLFRKYFGPTQVAFSKLDTGGQAALAADLEGLWKHYNRATDGTTNVPYEYLEVHAVRD
jgi:SAM-dependent methyltransferase